MIPKTRWWLWVALLAVGAAFVETRMKGASPSEIRIVTLDPGHFHAALFQKEMLEGISGRAGVYAPLGPDLTAHLNRMVRFNQRQENPTHWELEIYAGPDFWARMLRETPGNVVVISGRNRGKIERIRTLADRGFHVLADKPWIIEPADFGKLEAALTVAAEKKVAAYDTMTQRYEITCLLLRELVNDRSVFGAPLTGSEAEPAVEMRSTHSLFKEVAGVPNLRPAWFFDIRQQGEGLADVGTHLVDLAPWILFPDQAIDYRNEIQVLRGARWPTELTPAEFQRVTGEPAFPEFLAGDVKGGRLEYCANNRVQYTLRGLHCRLEVRWNFASPSGAPDLMRAVFRGTRARVELRQDEADHFRPEIDVIANRPADQAEVRAALERKLESLQTRYPGLALADRQARLGVIIPERYRIGHEAHFAFLTRKYLEYVRNPESLPSWEMPNMLAKYYVTTRGIELARAEKTDK